MSLYVTTFILIFITEIIRAMLTRLTRMGCHDTCQSRQNSQMIAALIMQHPSFQKRCKNRSNLAAIGIIGSLSKLHAINKYTEDWFHPFVSYEIPHGKWVPSRNLSRKKMKPLSPNGRTDSIQI